MIRTTTLAHLAVLTTILFAATTPASAQARVVFRCKKPGKYTLIFPGYPDRYCWDKVLYTPEDAPPEVRAYFVNQDRKNREINDRYQAHFRERWEARRAAERQQSAAVAAVAPAPVLDKPQSPRQVALDLVKELAVGATRSDVIAKLGQPNGRIFGSEETFTYLTPSGTARLKLSEGKVTSVALPQE